MKNNRLKLTTFLPILLILTACTTKIDTDKADTETPKATNEDIHFINYSVINAEDEDVAAIIKVWQSYIGGENQYDYDNHHWGASTQLCPNCFLREVDFKMFNEFGVQNSVIGVIPVNENEWELTSLFSNFNSQKKQIDLYYIIKVYAKKVNNAFYLFNRTDYLKNKWNNQKVGNITFYYNEKHKFNLEKANKLSKFNTQIADLFNTKKIDFEYFIAENAQETAKIRGYEFQPSTYVPNQFEALADVTNKIIYVGNDSEFYPHEVVHLYTKELFNYQYHSWIDEGFATMLGGSKGKSLNWHLDKLKVFLEENQDYELNDITKLNTVPNGEYTTEFRYVIGGLLVKEIFDKEGIDGVKEILQFGRSNEDFYNLLEVKFNVSKENFGKFIKEKLNIIRPK